MKQQLSSIPLVDLQAQYASIQAEVDEAVLGTLRTCDFILGQNVEHFEREFADFCGAEHAIGVDSGTSALELVLLAYGIGPGDEVITQANTFIATALAISNTGATPVLVDIDPDTYMIDPDLIEPAITEKTRAIIPVHLYGHPADMDAIMSIADRHGLMVLEDASQAHGARYQGRRVGSIGHAAAFSLYPSKNLGAYGDAGVITTNDGAIAERLRLLRNWGSIQKYHHEIQGYNRRLDTLHASVLRVKLRHLDAWTAARRRHAQHYTERLQDLPVVCPKEAADVEAVYHVYVIRTNARDELMEHLRECGIASVIHYPVPIHLQPAYASLKHRAGDFPHTEQCAKQILSLPMYAELEPELIARISESVRDFVESHADTLIASQRIAN